MGKVPFAGLEVFLAIARQGSIRGAARDLRLQPSTVSHQLKSLEERLGVALFARTTRSLGLTDAGRVLLQSAAPAMDQLLQAVAMAQEAHAVVRGELRINLPHMAYEMVLAERLGVFEDAYPSVRLDLALSDRITDIIAEGFHAGIRFGHRLREDMIAVPLSDPLPATVYASPRYLEEHGEPDTPGDLSNHKCIRYRFAGTRRLADWDFETPSGRVTVDPGCSLSVNSHRLAVDRAIRNQGIVHMPDRFVSDLVADGRLVPLLRKFSYSYPALYLYYPKESRQSELIRAFVRHFRAKP